MRTSVQRWGNSLALRIPKAYANETNLHEGSEVDFRVAEGGLVIEPVRPKRHSLQALLDRVTPSNLHGKTDSGEAVGKEIW